MRPTLALHPADPPAQKLARGTPIDRIADQKPYYARIRALGERAVAALEAWKILAKPPPAGHRDRRGRPRAAPGRD